MNNIINITMRDIQTAFNNASNKGLMNKPEEYMYMYTKTYEDGSTYDVFKNIMTRRHETVAI